MSSFSLQSFTDSSIDLKAVLLSSSSSSTDTINSATNSETANANETAASSSAITSDSSVKARRTNDTKSASINEKELTTATVINQTLPLVENKDTLNSQNHGTDRAQELEVITEKLRANFRPHSKCYDNSPNFAKFVQSNIFTIQDFVEAQDRPDDTILVCFSPSSWSYLTESMVDFLISQIIDNKFNQEDAIFITLVVFSPYEYRNLSPEMRVTTQHNNIENFVKLRKCGFSTRLISYFTRDIACYDISHKLEIFIDLVERKLLKNSELEEIFEKNFDCDMATFGAMTPNLVKYLEAGLINFQMIQLLKFRIGYLIPVLADTSDDSNKMRAMYEEFCQLIKADGTESWDLFYSTGCFYAFIVFFSKLVPWVSVQNVPADSINRTCNVQYWADIENRILSSQILFRLFTEIKTIVKQEGAVFTPRVLKNLLLIYAYLIENKVYEDESNSRMSAPSDAKELTSREYPGIFISLLRVILSKDNLLKLSEAAEMDLLAALEEHELTPTLINTQSRMNNFMSSTVRAFEFIIYGIHEGKLRSNAEVRSYARLYNVLKAFGQSFKLPADMPPEFDNKDYLDDLLGPAAEALFSIHTNRVRFEDLPAILNHLQHFHDNGGVTRFVHAVKTGMSMDKTKDTFPLLAAHILEFCLANFLGKLELSDITEYFKIHAEKIRQVSMPGEFMNHLYDILDGEGALGMLLDGKINKEEWMNGNINL